jgi:hypothetical protein
MWNDMEIMEENKLNSDKIWTNIEERQVEEWNNMKNMEDTQVE